MLQSHLSSALITVKQSTGAIELECKVKVLTTVIYWCILKRATSNYCENFFVINHNVYCNRCGGVVISAFAMQLAFPR